MAVPALPCSWAAATSQRNPSDKILDGCVAPEANEGPLGVVEADESRMGGDACAARVSWGGVGAKVDGRELGVCAAFVDGDWAAGP